MEVDETKIKHVEAFVFDIEGTICSISFVKDTLYPYFTKALPQYARDLWSDADFESMLRRFPDEAQESPEALIRHCDDLVKRDVKDSALKELQGRIWTAGYDTGAYAAPLYPDVLPFFRRIHAAAGRLLAIYSSGSVHAQRLLLAHVVDDDAEGAGDGKGSVDITGLFEGAAGECGGQQRLFDTVNAGPKTARGSYERIAEALGKGVAEVVFFTDNVEEAKAAKSAGVYVVVLVRPGNPKLPPGTELEFPVVEGFEGLAKLVE